MSPTHADALPTNKLATTTTTKHQKVKGKYWFGIGKGERRGGWYYIQATERAIGPECNA